MSKCTILVQTLTRERLKKIGRKGQSYDQLINQLIQNVNDLSLDHTPRYATGQAEPQEAG